MLILLFAALQPFLSPAAPGLFEAANLYLVRVTAVKVPDHPKLYGDTTLRVDEVLIGPKEFKGATASYGFFVPSGELRYTGGSQYSGRYPDFAYPAPQGARRYWWASPDRKGGWRTANFQTLAQYLPTAAAKVLLKADLKPDSPEAADQSGLVEALVRLDAARAPAARLAVLQALQASDNNLVRLLADRTLETLAAPPKPKK
jgi:hypothetical protein